MSIDRARREAGVTLIELIVFIVVVSVGLAGVLSVFNLTVARSADPLLVKQALAAADAMLEEILLKDFCDPDLTPPACTPSVEGTRSAYDNVDDYNGYSSTGVFSPVDLATPILAGYNVSVAVAQPPAALLGVPAADVRRIVVTVSYGADAVAVTGYRFNVDAP